MNIKYQLEILTCMKNINFWLYLQKYFWNMYKYSLLGQVTITRVIKYKYETRILNQWCPKTFYTIKYLSIKHVEVCK